MSEATRKQCPVLMLARKGLLGEDTKCIGDRCQWWTMVLTTEGLYHHDCSIPGLVGINSDGTLTV